MSFNKDIEKFKNRTEEAATKIFRGTALNLFGKIIKRTPVGDPDVWQNPDSAPSGYAGGRLRSNWYSSINTPSKTKDGAGEGAKSTTDRAKLGDSIYFVNNLEYAGAIENGHSRFQAPYGMVRITILEFENTLKKEAAKHKL